jgi:hypothetical protein
MVVSTLVTLFVVPAGYSVLDDGLEWLRSRRRQQKGRADSEVAMVSPEPSTSEREERVERAPTAWTIRR